MYISLSLPPLPQYVYIYIYIYIYIHTHAHLYDFLCISELLKFGLFKMLLMSMSSIYIHTLSILKAVIINIQRLPLCRYTLKLMKNLSISSFFSFACFCFLYKSASFGLPF